MKNCVIMKKIKTNHCNQSKNQPSKPITSIDCLPDECLFLIFQELSLYEAVNIERGIQFLFLYFRILFQFFL